MDDDDDDEGFCVEASGVEIVASSFMRCVKDDRPTINMQMYRKPQPILSVTSTPSSMDVEKQIAVIKMMRKKYKTLYEMYHHLHHRAVYQNLFDQRTENEQMNCFNGALISSQNFMEYFNLLNNQKSNSRFNSCFEGGNMHSVYQVSRTQFDLLVRNDINCSSYGQWFYFVMKMDNRPVRLNIIVDNLFLDLKYVWVRGEKHLKDWTRQKYRLQVVQTKVLKAIPRTELRLYHKIVLDVTNQEEEKKLEIALTEPYTYTQMTKYLKKVSSRHQWATISTLAQSCISIPLLQLNIDKPSPNPKQSFVIIARQAPLQTECSRFMECIVNEILNNQFLLQNYTFVVIPIVNITGVYFGNSKCDVQGNILKNAWGGARSSIINALKQRLEGLSEIAIVIEIESSMKVQTTNFKVFNNPSPYEIFMIVKQTYEEFKDSKIELVEQNKDRSNFHYFIQNSCNSVVRSILITVPEVIGSHVTANVILKPRGFINRLSKKIIGSLSVYEASQVSPDDPNYAIWQKLKSTKRAIFKGINMIITTVAEIEPEEEEEKSEKSEEEDQEEEKSQADDEEEYESSSMMESPKCRRKNKKEKIETSLIDGVSSFEVQESSYEDRQEKCSINLSASGTAKLLKQLKRSSFNVLPLSQELPTTSQKKIAKKIATSPNIRKKDDRPIPPPRLISAQQILSSISPIPIPHHIPTQPLPKPTTTIQPHKELQKRPRHRAKQQKPAMTLFKKPFQGRIPKTKPKTLEQTLRLDGLFQEVREARKLELQQRQACLSSMRGVKNSRCGSCRVKRKPMIITVRMSVDEESEKRPLKKMTRNRLF